MLSVHKGASDRPPSNRSNHSGDSKSTNASIASEETSPLLSRQGGEEEPISYSAIGNGAVSQPLQDNLDDCRKNQTRWGTIIALSVLSILVIAILSLGFVASAIVEEYAREALVVEPTSISIHSFTATGARARIQGDFVLDGSRVQKKAVRDLGRAGTWIAKEVESEQSVADIYLPEYDNSLLGTVDIPPIKVSIRDGHFTHLDFLVNVEPGNVDAIRRVADDWLNGNLASMAIKGVASVALKSGIFRLGTHTLSQSLLLQGGDIPKFPEFDIEELKFTEYGPPGEPTGMVAEASVSIMNDYPLEFDVPPLQFDILVPNCLPHEDHLQLGQARTAAAHIVPREYVIVNVTGTIQQLSKYLTQACPGSNSSPLDSLLGSYLEGKDTTIFVRGSGEQDPSTPGWITSLITDTTVPFPLSGRPFDNLIRNFSLTDVHFSLPDPLADPNTPDSQPMVSANVKALVGLPKEMNFDLGIDRVRADADVFYHGKKLGKLDLHKWQEARASRVNGTSRGPALLVESKVKNAPLHITDDDLFTEIVQALIFSGKGAVLGVEAAVDVHTATVLGDFVVREIPASGQVFIKPLGGSVLSGFKPQISDLEVVETTKASLRLHAKVNLTNPTEYSVHVPYVNIHILHNDTLVGHATVENIDVVPGNNTNLVVEALWSPSDLGGQNGSEVGRNLLSQYISGYNTTITLRTHESTIPSQPTLGKALSSLKITLDAPKLSAPQFPGDDNNDDGNQTAPRFIKDATMHLISSTATFTLLSPLPHTTIYITSISATAFYNHTEPVGNIDYAYQLAVPPGASQTPKLPVVWDISGAGYSAVRDALGGTLKLDAEADVGVRIGSWHEKIWFKGGGIGASIRL